MRFLARPRGRAHPRSRGENDADGPRVGAHPGSSPLTRGKRPGIPVPPRPGRLIPAHAGKTGIHRRDKGVTAAHPRSRGENENGGKAWNKATGSSPLTRGKHPGLRGRPGSRGLIPAHAGKTWSPTARSAWRTAHPRSRGENIDGFVSGIKSAGSSPLTRGKR